jgi:hypothetical protein
MRVPLSSWNLFIVMTLGLIVLLVGQRPDLRGPDDDPGPGRAVRIVGHSISWSAAAVLAGRMIRSARSGSEAQTAQPEQPERVPSEPNEPDEPSEPTSPRRKVA